MRKLYDLEKEKICWKPWMISGVGIWTGLVAMGLLLGGTNRPIVSA